MATKHPRVLIEEWLPVAELGIESRRERGASSALPPLNYLHIWWARRPLVASVGVVLAGLLPVWSQDLADEFPGAKQLATESAYRRWFLWLCGIRGDAVGAQKAQDAAKAEKKRLKENPFTYRQAYRYTPEPEHLDLLHRVLVRTWGRVPVVADPTAGGGSIPFTAVRVGLPTFANDLNGVAASVLEAGVAIPRRYGVSLLPHLNKWGGELVRRHTERLADFFPTESGEKVMRYLWANAVACPRTGRLVPLMQDKWVRRVDGSEVAVRLLTEIGGRELTEPQFVLDFGKDIDSTDASAPLVKGGKGISPYDNLVIESSYIKEQAVAGLMTSVLYAVSIEKAGEPTFRAPSDADFKALEAASTRLASVRSQWEATGVVPASEIPYGSKTKEPLQMGSTHWADLFTDRQLLVHGTFGELLREIAPEVRAELGDDVGDAVLFELALMQGKAINWNAKLSSWNVNYQRMRSVFDSHNFATKWTFAEMEGAHDIYGWAFSQATKSYREIAELLGDSVQAKLATHADVEAGLVRVTQGSAAHLDWEASSVDHICMDPPYYNNVMYAELADFFYSWERGTLGAIRREFFPEDLSDKENEAVANPARFESLGRRKNELADLDYEAKMTSIFGECRRVLRDEGVLSVMFTHKRAEAWDTLGMGLLQAGFTIETSWPVNTEFANSLHQANMNSAASTIMLVCRKRDERQDGTKVYLDDIDSEIRQAARDAATRFQHDGIDGVDLLLSTYGPTLSVISQNWPVYSSTPDADGRDKLLRPEDALAIAREEIVELRRARLVGKAQKVDSVTDFVLLAWDTFGAREFPFDTARLLALAVGGLDISELESAKVISATSGTAKLLEPKDRLRRGADSGLPGVKPEAQTFEYMIDAVDTALYIAEVDGQQAVKRFFDQRDYANNSSFIATVQGLVNAIPRTKVKDEWIVPEAKLLDTICTLYFPAISLPEAEDIAAQVIDAQGSLFEVE